MKPFRTISALLAVSLVLGFVALAMAAPEPQKEKPKNAASFDDYAGTLTETVDGKEKKSKIELKYALKVKGYFDKDGFNLEEVDTEGPAAMLTEPGGGGAILEKGDIITEVEGKKVTSAQDYAKAINGAKDSSKIKLKVRDINTGNVLEFIANASSRKIG